LLEEAEAVTALKLGTGLCSYKITISRELKFLFPSQPPVRANTAWRPCPKNRDFHFRHLKGRRKKCPLSDSK